MIPTIVSQILAGGEVRLGQLDAVRDFTYVVDTAEGFIHVAEADACLGRVTNLGSGSGITIRDLAQKIAELLERRGRIVVDEQRVRPERSEVFRLISDATQARMLAGWEPRVPLEDGLRSVVDYVRTHPEEYKPALYAV